MRTYRVTVNGTTYLVEVEETGEASLGSGGGTAAVPSPVAVPAAKHRSDRETASTGENVKISAPMPGTVLELRAGEGEPVKKGQTILILEAMKMENEIMAPEDGILKNVAVSVGASVKMGDPLFSIQK